jgi:hypothetical protein
MMYDPLAAQLIAQGMFMKGNDEESITGRKTACPERLFSRRRDTSVCQTQEQRAPAARDATVRQVTTLQAQQRSLPPTR